MNNYNYNPYNYLGGNTSRENLFNQYQQLQQQLSGLNAQINPQQIPQQHNNNNFQSIGNNAKFGGSFIYVNDYDELVNYPTPADGTPILGFCLPKQLFWCKKFVNGQNSIQAFTMSPINTIATNDTTPTEKPKSIEDRVMGLENSLDKILNILDKGEQENDTNRHNVEQTAKREGKSNKKNDEQ